MSDNLFLSFDLMLVPNILLVNKPAAVLSLHQRFELSIILDCIYSFLFLFFVELRVSSIFLEEPNCSLEKFIVRHHEALGQLDNLTVTTL